MSDINYDVAHKFNLKGLRLGDNFLGCIPCRKIYAVNAVGVPQCGNCIGVLKRYTVTYDDLVRLKIEGDFYNGNNDLYRATEICAPIA